MTNYVDSTAHFNARAGENQLPNELVVHFRNNGIDPLGKLAFAVFRPGADYGENIFNGWARDLNNGVMATMGAFSLSTLRNLMLDPPPGYNATSMTQVLRADKEVTQMTSGLMLQQAALQNYQTNFHLLPLPKASVAETAYARKGNKWCLQQGATCVLQRLRANASKVREHVLADVTSSGDLSVDSEVRRKTLEEVGLGWLAEGPLLYDAVPLDTPLSRRFGLVQNKGKVRLIDDYTETGINACVITTESPTLHTVDVACAIFGVWLKRCRDEGISHKLAVRTFDLKSAYRQVGLSAAERDFAFLRVFDPEAGQAAIFRGTALPFGAIRSVHSFLRPARAVWWIGVVGCGLLWASFYDDYICTSTKLLAGNAEKAVVSLFRLTGWLFAEDGDKCKPFDTSCEALGVMFHVALAGDGCIQVKNTQSRVDDLKSEIEDVVKIGRLSAKAAQRLRGRMQFADSQLYGKCLRVLSDFAESTRWKLQPKDVFFLRLFSDMM
eukprot:s2538_g2.t1